MVEDSASNDVFSAPLAEALAEVAYLFQCPSNVNAGDATSDSASQSCHCIALAASEPSKTPVPWPHPEDCHSAPGLAGYTELCLVRVAAPEPAQTILAGGALTHPANSRQICWSEHTQYLLG